jgi:hypothetical protein
MREKTPFSELSDADFVALLKESEKGSNWTLGQVAEYELRGPDFLANDKGLREKIDGVLKNHQTTMLSVFEPFQRSLDAMFLGAVSNFSKFSIPVSTFPILVNNPSLIDEDIDSTLVKEATQKEMSNSYKKSLASIEFNTRFGWKQWLMLGVTLLGAAAAIVAATLAAVTFLS